MADARFWIIGHPLKFCLTTPVMNGALEDQGLTLRFETVDLEPEKLEEVMEKIRRGELEGAVVTMPFKTPSLVYLDEATEEVKAINAANVVIGKGGKLFGHNTDWQGAIGAIKGVLPALAGKTALILGAGGAARAAAYALQQEGVSVALWNRSPDRARSFVQERQIEWVEDLSRWEGQPDIVINATAASSQDRQKSMIPFPLWAKVELALDAVYGKTSLFLEEAKAAKVRHTISGEIWFLNQVFPLFELLTGKPAPRELMERLTHGSQEIVS